MGEIQAEVRARIGWVTLSRPQKRNALTTAMWRAIPGVLHALAARQDVLSIVLTGAEGTFAAGADLEDVLAATAGRAEALSYCTSIVTALLAVATAPLPTLALVEGVAAGGGAELALACDLRVADPSASFSFPFARLGVVPDRFTLDRLAATVGATNARRLVFTGETVDAARALSMGLVDEVCETGELAQTAAAWGEDLRRGSRSARTAMKRALAGAETTHDVAALVAPMVDSMLGGEVHAAAVRFLEKRS